jgi:phospholipid/cholesterol/gamma-HCH transport system substrate-binding protein
MIFGKSRLELKVGIFVFIGLCILMLFVVSIGNFKARLRSHNINFLFHFANGVRVGAPIRFAGYDIGEVKKLGLVFDPAHNDISVRMVGWVRSDVKIPADSSVWINTLGLLGEKYIEIMPGKDFAHQIKTNQTIIGHDPMASQEMMSMLKDTVDGIDAVVAGLTNKEGTIGKLLYDDAVYRDMLGITKGLQDSIANFNTSVTTITEDFEGLIADIRAHPWKLFFKEKEQKKK